MSLPFWRNSEASTFPQVTCNNFAPVHFLTLIMYQNNQRPPQHAYRLHLVGELQQLKNLHMELALPRVL